ncbi:MAG: hypothetical protein HIU81_07200 [Acidobacteria bacterium]|nr:hypothetical protein [Acidobacteriota bacterium]
MPASSTQQQSASVTSAPLESAHNTLTVPVYWLGHSNQDVYLYREFLPSSAASDPIQSALNLMTEGNPLDPDFFTPWKKPSKLGASISGSSLITVDISSDAFTKDVDAGIAQRAIAELVYTASAAAANAGLIDKNENPQVSILVDGHTDYMAFGKIKLDKPLTRDLTLLAPVWIIDPQQDVRSTSPVTVNGRAVSADGQVQWQVNSIAGDDSRTTVSSGSTPVSGAPGQIGLFHFKLSLNPGTYEVRVWEKNDAKPSQQMAVDNKKFTVK